MQRQRTLEYDMPDETPDRKPMKNRADAHTVSVWIRQQAKNLAGLTRQEVCDRLQGATGWVATPQQLALLIRDFDIKLKFARGGSSPKRMARVHDELAKQDKELAGMTKRLDAAAKLAAKQTKAIAEMQALVKEVSLETIHANERCDVLVFLLSCTAKVVLNGSGSVKPSVASEVRDLAARHYE